MNISNEDNIALMSRYEDNYFNLAIVDPPYGIDIANMNMGIGNTPKASKAKNRKWKAKDWDSDIPSEQYFKELFRVSKNQIIWGGNYFDLPPCGKFIIWDKEIPKGLSFSDCEYAWTSFKGANNMFRYSAYRNKSEKFHPTQKPLALLNRLILSSTDEEDLVLDAFNGSGTTGVSCIQNKRRYIGIELESEYIKLTKKRLEEIKKI